MAPALLSIALWMYWPLARGSAIAFQDYRVIGQSDWVGSANFASVLYSEEFWYSLRISIVYAVLFIALGFWVPIALALLLQEVPRGRVLFRTIFYLPAVLSGVVVIFLWKSFYSPDGLVNQLLNIGVWLINFLPGVRVSEFNSSWLESPGAALLCTLLPTVWVAMGPGCLIYLAALKTVPDELYEAADIDGAGVRRKIFNIALPSIRSLIAINFIGAVIGAVRGASAFMLAMTGGGPFGEQGGATEVIGLKIFYTTFGQLQFGVGAAMAWVLGSMLIGFTVIQLQRISRLEFRTAGVQPS
jgi:multiple sugar transport system permease protein